MRAIVHLGMPKCGSTTIQAFLNANAAALASQGIAYDALQWRSATGRAHEGVATCANAAAGQMIPAPAVKRAFGIFNLKAQRRFADQFEPFMRKTVAARKEEVFVISSEYLGASAKTGAVAQAMHDWFLGMFSSVDYILYVRRQEDWIASSWSQKLRRGGTLTLDEWVDRATEQDWLRVVRRWVKVAGQDHVRVQIMEKDALKDGDLINDFCAMIGVDRAGLRDVPSKNTSLSLPAAEILRSLNEKLDHTIQGGRRMNPAKRHLRDLLLHLPGPHARITLSPAQTEIVRARYAQSNATLCAEWFPDRTELFPARPVEAYDLAPSEVADAAAQLLADHLRPGPNDVWKLGVNKARIWGKQARRAMRGVTG